MTTSPSLQSAFDAFQRNDERAAAREFRSLAEQHPMAAFFYGWLRWTKGGNAQTTGQGLNWIRNAAERGLDIGCYFFGYAYLTGMGVEKDAATAIHWLEKAATENYAPALFVLGDMYLNGISITRDTATGIDYFRRGALQAGGCNPAWEVDDCKTLDDFLDRVRGECITSAQENLAIIYANGVAGIAPNQDEAAKWMEKAVANGLVDASLDLASIHEDRGDYRASNKYLLTEFRRTKSAEAAYRLGRQYHYGLEMAKNPYMARTFYGMALKHRPHPLAAFELAKLARETSERDFVYNYRQEVENDPQTMVALAQMYEAGDSVPRDSALAYKWYCRAAEHGIEEAMQKKAHYDKVVPADLREHWKKY